MPTIFRMTKSDMQDIVKLVRPDLPEKTLQQAATDKLRVYISEWLLQNGFSTLHEFSKNPSNQWVHPIEERHAASEESSISESSQTESEAESRKRQMLYFGGPWNVEIVRNKKGKDRYRIRSHLLEKSVLAE